MSKAWLTVLAAVVLLPVFVRYAIATEIWIFAIFGLGLNLLLVLAIGVVVGAVTAAAVGYLCVQRAGLYFIMLTFALNQMFYFTAYQWTTVTGGEDGMPGIPRPPLFGIDLNGTLTYYAFVSVV